MCQHVALIVSLTDCVSTVSMHSINAVLHRFAVDLGPLLVDATGAAGASLAALTAALHKLLACNSTHSGSILDGTQRASDIA